MSRAESTRGYVVGASYPATYFRELSPVWLNYVATLNGTAPRDLDDAFAHLELGCGPGGSAITHAAAWPRGEFHACDHDSDFVAEARQHAETLGIANLRLHEASFDRLLERDLPELDFVVLHGVYSWVTPAVRRSIRRIIHAKLKRGGLVYVSYNCMPGWADETPVRRLLLELAAHERGDWSARTTAALDRLRRLSRGNLSYFTQHAAAVAAVENYLGSPVGYVAHEFLNEAWTPFYSVDVADEMREAGLAYVGSATLADNHLALLIDDSVAESVSALPAQRQRALAIDYAVNRRFRRDVFVRAEGAADRGAPAADAILGCLSDPDLIEPRVTVPRGRITFGAEFVRELRKLMARGSTSLRNAAVALADGRREQHDVVRNLLYLAAAGTLAPFAAAVELDSGDRPRRFSSQVVERMVLEVARRASPGPIASAVVGGGVQLQPGEAASLIDWFRGAGARSGTPTAARAGASEPLARRCMRLGLLA